MMDNDAAKKQLEFLKGGFKLLCQSGGAIFGDVDFDGGNLEASEWIAMTEAQFLGDEYSEKDKLACVSDLFAGQAKSWFQKELSWIPFNSWSQVKDGLLLTFGNNRDKKRVLMELDLEMKQWIKDFDRKMEPYKFLESEAIVVSASS
ncbi:unnamed protein product [Arabidopsis thaliana]|uniref:Retrotransposon gag domain-containing protein n=1 Tax=Arabidopsis thaliana TaxID=3702 RepID=A0A5S9WJ38_ARATH|nr:unnamed protein product [Arabidopsis thaliana]